MPPARRGFTLIELLIAIAIGAILVSIAIPAWRTVAIKAHATSTRSALLASLNRAASHAGTTGVEVVVCPAAPEGCANQWDWSEGWIAFADSDGDRRHDANEVLLRRQPPLEAGIQLFTSKGRKRLVFQPNGGNVGSNVTFTLCRGNSLPPIVMVMANDGRLRNGSPGKAQLAHCATFQS